VLQIVVLMARSRCATIGITAVVSRSVGAGRTERHRARNAGGPCALDTPAIVAALSAIDAAWR
jgi:hypothetical protein